MLCTPHCSWSSDTTNKQNWLSLRSSQDPKQEWSQWCSAFNSMHQHAPSPITFDERASVHTAIGALGEERGRWLARPLAGTLARGSVRAAPSSRGARECTQRLVGSGNDPNGVFGSHEGFSVPAGAGLHFAYPNWYLPEQRTCACRRRASFWVAQCRGSVTVSSGGSLKG